MAFNPFTIIKSLLIKEENTLTPKQIEIVPGGTANTKTTLVGSQTTDKTLTLPNATDTLTANAATQSLTNKTIDADLNTITNIENADIKVGAAIDAAKIHNGSVSNTEFGYLDGVTSSIQTQLNTNATNIADHISDAVGAHAASAISNTPAGTIAATDLQAAVNELDGDIQAHINDTVGAHGAGAISNTPSGNLVATDVQGALNEIQTELDAAVIVGNNAATKELNNLTTTSLNADLLPSGAGARNLGSSSLPFGTTNTETLTRQTVGNLTISTSSGSLLLNPSTIIDANNKLVSNVAAPVSAGDAVNKEYADSIAAGFDPKAAVRVATTASLGGSYATTPSNGRFTGAATVVDGVTLAANDRVLVKDQVDLKQNGIYVYDGAGQYTRAADSDGTPAAEVSSGNFTFATQGTLNSASGFVLLGNGILALNVDNLAWTQSSGGASGASRFLDNLLSPVAINQDLLPGATNSRDLGSSSLRFKDAHLQGNLNFNGSLIGTNISGSSNDVTTSSVNSVLESPTLNLRSGNNSGAGGSGNVILDPGTAGGTRGSTLLRGNRISVESTLNLVQGQNAIPLSGQQSLTIPSNSNAEGLVTLTASDSTTRNILTAASTGLPQAPNLIINGDAEGKLTSSVSIFTPYSDAAGTSPVDGIGGSPNVTSSVTATTPLSGSKSYLLTKDAVNRQGQGWSILDVAVPQAMRARVLSIKFDYIVNSGTFNAGTSSADSDVTIWIYDIGNLRLIQPSSYKLLSNSTTVVDQFQAEFQTPIDMSSFRLIAHIGTTNASAYTLELDNIVVSPSEYVFGSPISDPVDAGVQTITAVTSNPIKGTTSSDKVTWHREGKFAVITYDYRQTTGGTAGTGDYLWALPSGLAIDTTYNPVYTGTFADTSAMPSRLDATGRQYSTVPQSLNIIGAFPYTTSTFRVAVQSEFASTGFIGSGLANLTTAAYGFSFTVKVPIAGWSSSVQMADQTSTRIVAAKYQIANGITSSTVLPINAATQIFDTHAAVTTGSGWRFTAPVSGFYEVMLGVYMGGSSVNMYVYKNGTRHSYVATSIGAAGDSGATTVQLNAGDYIDIRSSSAATVDAVSVTEPFIAVQRISGPSQIASVERIAASYWASANFVSSLTTPINFDSREFDTHNAVTTSPTAWRFTAPAFGIYSINSILTQAVTASVSYFIYRNGTAYKFIGTGSTFNGRNQSSTLVTLNSGDFIDIRVATTISGAASLATAGVSQITISRIGGTL
jgi:hypothetical protein